MALTVEQKKVVNKFRERYFNKVALGQTKISLADFLDKTRQEQIDFVKAWAQKRHNNLLTLETNLNQQLGRVAAEKAIIKQALRDWGVII